MKLNKYKNRLYDVKNSTRSNMRIFKKGIQKMEKTIAEGKNKKLKQLPRHKRLMVMMKEKEGVSLMNRVKKRRDRKEEGEEIEVERLEDLEGEAVLGVEGASDGAAQGEGAQKANGKRVSRVSNARLRSYGLL